METFDSWYNRKNGYWDRLFSYGYGDSAPSLHWQPSEKRTKARVGVTINHRRPRNKARAAMARKSRRINRA